MSEPWVARWNGWGEYEKALLEDSRRRRMDLDVAGSALAGILQLHADRFGQCLT